MKRWFWIGALAALFFMSLLITGCVSQSTARARERAAFLAGQQQAAQQLRTFGPSVTVVGEVKNKLVPWTADLTLAHAIVAAEYYGTRDPEAITIIREGQQIHFEPHRLLSGEDMPLQPRDIIVLKSFP